jgi:16S rRNA U1498 N3-methylase RsmE
VPVTLEENDALSRIRLEGAIEIDCAAELKALLVQALSSGKETRIAIEAATHLDVTAIQLLWAAKREAARSGARFALSPPAPEGIAAALREAGFEIEMLKGA